MPFQRVFLQGIFGKVLPVFFLQADARNLPVSESVEKERPPSMVSWIRHLHPRLLFVKCLIIKNYGFSADTEAFQYGPHFPKWLLCMDMLGELDFCGLDFNCPV